MQDLDIVTADKEVALKINALIISAALHPERDCSAYMKLALAVLTAAGLVSPSTNPYTLGFVTVTYSPEAFDASI